MNMKRYAVWLLALLGIVFARPTATGTGGAAATVDALATRAAMEILSQGGNAVDAAVAAAAVLGVTEPYSCGIGGGGFMVIYLAREGRVITIDHRETAPASFTPTVFNGPNNQPLPFAERVNSGLSVGVPGTVKGWEEALRRYGTLSLGRVLQPAIRVAQQGFTVDATFAAQTQANLARFRYFTSTSALFLPGGAVPAVGSTFRNPDLARTYLLLAAGGSRAFYSGPVAEAIVNTVNNPPVASGVTANIRPGRMTLADLANYEVRIRQPIVSTYRGYTIYGMGLPSSGGPTIALALNLLEGYDLKALPRERALHLYLEASRLAFADRNAYMGDPEFLDAPLTGLLSKRYAEERRKTIGDRAAEGAVRAGDPYPFQQDPSAPLRPQALGERWEGESTTHLTVSDKEGNIVSYTFTIESTGGNAMVVPGYGFLLNNELTDFDATVPHPNSPEAFKRPRSSMSPTLVFRDGKPVLALGSPGGATIITTVLQTLVNVLDFGLPIDQALAAPRLSQRNTQNTNVDGGFERTPEAQALTALGHRFAPPAEIGALTAIAFNPDGSVTAAAEPVRRGGGSAAVERPR